MGNSTCEYLPWLNTAWTNSSHLISCPQKQSYYLSKVIHIIFCSTLFFFCYFCNIKTCASISSSLPYCRFSSLRHLDPKAFPGHSTSGKPFPPVCHPSMLIMQVALSAKTSTCNTLPIPFQTQVLLNSKLLFPWTKHSAEPKARTYLWCLTTWCSELPWPLSTAVAVLMLFSW